MQHTEVARDELLSFYLSSEDQLGNFREAVWSLDAPGAGEDQEQEVRDGENAGMYYYAI